MTLPRWLRRRPRHPVFVGLHDPTPGDGSGESLTKATDYKLPTRGVALSDTDRAGVMFLLADIRGTVETVAGVLDDENNPRAAYLAGQLAGLVDRLDRFEERFYERTEP